MTEQAPSGPPRDATDTVSFGVRVAAAWTWRLLLLGFGVYVLARIFERIELVAFSFVIALFFTAILHPLEQWLRRIPGSRSVSAGLALLIGVAVLGGIGTFVVWQITSHSTELGDQISGFVDRTRDWLRTGPLNLKSSDLDNIADQITKTIKDHQGELISGAIATVSTVVEALGALLLIILATFFCLRDGEDIWRWAVRLVPRGVQARVDTAGHAGWRALGGYIRGLVLIALFDGVAVMIVLFVLRVPLAPALGVLIFLGAFVPLIGLTVTGALACGVALLEHGLGAALVTLIAIVVLVQLEAHLLQPFIMSRSVQVHPLSVAMSVLTGTLLAGIVGALLAVPLVAFVNSVVHALRETPAVPTGDSGFPVTGRDSPDSGPIDLASPSEAEDRHVPPADEPPGTSADA